MALTPAPPELDRTVHDLRGVLNTLGTALALAEIRARQIPELRDTVAMARRSFDEAQGLLETVIAAARANGDRNGC
jgi:hypothetical protein